MPEDSQQDGRPATGQRSVGLFILDRLGPLLGLVIVVVLFTAYRRDFLAWQNFLNISSETAVFATLAVGQTFVIISGGIDLSVAAVTAFSGVVAVLTLEATGSTLAGILAGCGTGAGVGLVNGLISAYGRMPAFIVTLGSMLICRGVGLLLAEGGELGIADDNFEQIFGGTYFIGKGFVPSASKAADMALRSDFVGTWRDLRLPVVIMLLGALIAYLVLNRARLGRYTYAIGSNAEAARLSGVNVRLYQTAVFTISGFMAGLAGMLLVARVSSADAEHAQYGELTAIAATVIGGTSLMGGEGSIGGAVVGALMLATVSYGLQFTGADPYWERVATGAIIVLAVLVDRIRRQLRSRA